MCSCEPMSTIGSKRARMTTVNGRMRKETCSPPKLMRCWTMILSLEAVFMGTFTVEIPEALRELGYSDEEIRREVPVLLVLKRFRQGTISSGKAASLLGLSRRDFLDLLTREGIPVYDPTDQELADEWKTVRRFGTTE